MTSSTHTLRSLAGLLACYAVAGFCWWSTFGCAEEIQPLEPEIHVVGTGPTPTTTTRCLDSNGDAIACSDRDESTAVIACLSLPPGSGADWGEDDCGCQDPPDDPTCAMPDSCEMDLTGNSSPECTVGYCPLSEPLSVTASGTGRVTSDPPGIDCSAATCNAVFCDGAVVTLTATARVGSGAFFDGWTGHSDCAALGNVTSVTLDAARQCTATFRQPVVQVSVLGSGKVVGSVPGIAGCRSSSPASECAAPTLIGSSVKLSAFADPGANFLMWGGDCEGVASQSATLVVDADKTCTASFTSVPGGGGVGVIEIVSRADDESFTPDGLGADLIDASDDLSVAAFVIADQSILARDRMAGTTREVSPPPPFGFPPFDLSADGRSIVFETLVDPFSVTAPYQIDLQTLEPGPLSPPIRISQFDPLRGTGFDPEGGGQNPSLSGNGRYVVYETSVPFVRDDLEAGQSGGPVILDTCLGAPAAEGCTSRAVAFTYDDVSGELDFAGSVFSPSSGRFEPVQISRDGRFVLYFGYDPSELVTGEALYLYDRDSDDDGVYDEDGATSKVSVLPGISFFKSRIFMDASGRYVGFSSIDPTLPDNANPPPSGREFVRDTCAGAPAAENCVPKDVMVSVQLDGLPDYQPIPFGPFQGQFIDFNTRMAHLSASGRYVALVSEDRRLGQINPTTFTGLMSVVRDTCIGAPPAPPDCVPTNKILSRRTDGSLILMYGIDGIRIADDGTAALWIGPRDLSGSEITLIPSEVLLATTGLPLETGGVPRITATYPVKAVSPLTAAKGSGAFLITIRGEGFVPGATVTWNGEPRRTIFVSPYKLQAWITDFDLDPPVTPAVRFLRVVNPGGGTSTPQVSFTITASVAAVCGDGTKANTEACDDGNTDPGDGCSASCTVEAGFSCPLSFPCRSICGDGLVVTGEECDPGVLGGPVCTSTCTMEVVFAICGDGVVTPPEECDPFEVGGPACRADCTLHPGVSIIDAVVTPPLPPGVNAHFADVTHFIEVEVSSPDITLSLTCEDSVGVCAEQPDVSPPFGSPPTVQIALSFLFPSESYRFGLIASEGGVSSPETEVLYDRAPGVGELRCEAWTDGAPGNAEQRRYGLQLVRPSGVAVGSADYFVYFVDGSQVGWRPFEPFDEYLGVASAQLIGTSTTIPSGVNFHAIAVDRTTTPPTAYAAREFRWNGLGTGPTQGCRPCSRTVGGSGSCQIIPPL